MPSPFDLTDRIAFVTGAVAGSAARLPERWRTPAPTSSPSGSRLLGSTSPPTRSDQRAGEAWPSSPTSAIPIRWDTAVETALGEFRRIDIPVNAAGIARHSASEETSDDDWRRIIDVNLDGTYFCCRAVGRHRLEVTQRYVTLLDADLRAAHKRFSPGDDLARLGGFARRDRPVSCPGEGP